MRKHLLFLLLAAVLGFAAPLRALAETTWLEISLDGPSGATLVVTDSENNSQNVSIAAGNSFGFGYVQVATGEVTFAPGEGFKISRLVNGSASDKGDGTYKANIAASSENQEFSFKMAVAPSATNINFKVTPTVKDALQVKCWNTDYTQSADINLTGYNYPYSGVATLPIVEFVAKEGEIKSVTVKHSDGTEASLKDGLHGWTSEVKEGDVFTVTNTGANANLELMAYNGTGTLDGLQFIYKGEITALSGARQTVTLPLGSEFILKPDRGYEIGYTWISCCSDLGVAETTGKKFLFTSAGSGYVTVNKLAGEKVTIRVKTPEGPMVITDSEDNVTNIPASSSFANVEVAKGKVTFAPAEGYKIVELSMGGATNAGDGTYYADITAAANFWFTLAEDVPSVCQVKIEINKKKALAVIDAEGNRTVLTEFENTLELAPGTVALVPEGLNFVEINSSDFDKVSDENGVFIYNVSKNGSISAYATTDRGLSIKVSVDDKSAVELLAYYDAAHKYSSGALTISGTASLTAKVPTLAYDIAFRPVGDANFKSVIRSSMSGNVELTETDGAWYSSVEANDQFRIELAPMTMDVNFMLYDGSAPLDKAVIKVDGKRLELSGTSQKVTLTTGDILSVDAEPGYAIANFYAANAKIVGHEGSATLVQLNAGGDFSLDIRQVVTVDVDNPDAVIFQNGFMQYPLVAGSNSIASVYNPVVFRPSENNAIYYLTVNGTLQAPDAEGAYELNLNPGDKVEISAGVASATYSVNFDFNTLKAVSFITADGTRTRIDARTAYDIPAGVITLVPENGYTIDEFYSYQYVTEDLGNGVYTVNVNHSGTIGAYIVKDSGVAFKVDVNALVNIEVVAWLDADRKYEVPVNLSGLYAPFTGKAPSAASAIQFLPQDDAQITGISRVTADGTVTELTATDGLWLTEVAADDKFVLSVIGKTIKVDFKLYDGSASLDMANVTIDGQKLDLSGTQTTTEIHCGDVLCLGAAEGYGVIQSWCSGEMVVVGSSEEGSLVRISSPCELYLEIQPLCKVDVNNPEAVTVTNFMGLVFPLEAGVNFLSPTFNTCTVKPNEGYEIFSITVNDVAAQPNADGSYSLTLSYGDNVKIDAGVPVVEYAVTFDTDGIDNAISFTTEDGTKTVVAGNEAYMIPAGNITVAPEEGYEISLIFSTNATANGDGTYTVLIDSDLYLIIEVEDLNAPKLALINSVPTYDTDGVTLMGNVWLNEEGVSQLEVEVGSNVKLIAAPAEGYLFDGFEFNLPDVLPDEDGNLTVSSAMLEGLTVSARFIVDPESGLADILAGGLSYNRDAAVLYAPAAVKVFSTNGVLVLSAEAGKVAVDHLVSGTYIAVSGNVVIKFVK